MSGPIGWLRNCIICAKPGDKVLFYFAENGSIHAQLDGYAIIPKEVFEAMGGTASDTYQKAIAALKLNNSFH